MDLEAPVPSTTVASEPVTPTPASAPVVTPDPVETEAGEHAYVDQRGQQVVPLATFLESKKQAKALEAANKATEEKAAKLEAWAQQWSPYLQALSNRPDLLQQALTQTAPSKESTPQPTTDPEAEALARELDLYTPQGQPDTARAQRMLDKIDSRVERRIAREVEPVRLMTEEAKATTLRQQAYNYVQTSGYARPEALTQVLQMIPSNLQADPQVMNLALVLARGIGTGGTPAPAFSGSFPVASTGAPQGPLTEPLVSEAPGRRPGPLPLSDLETRVAQHRGISADRWRKLTDTTNPVLE